MLSLNVVERWFTTPPLPAPKRSEPSEVLVAAKVLGLSIVPHGDRVLVVRGEPEAIDALKGQLAANLVAIVAMLRGLAAMTAKDAVAAAERLLHTGGH